MRPRSAKEKGNRFEYWLRDLLKEELDENTRKNMMSGAGYDKGDLWIPSINASIEAKNQKNIKLLDWWEQTKKEALHDQIPILAIRNPRKPEFEETLAVIEINNLISLIRTKVEKKQLENKSLAWSVQTLKIACQRVLKEIV